MSLCMQPNALLALCGEYAANTNMRQQRINNTHKKCKRFQSEIYAWEDLMGQKAVEFEYER